VGYPDHDAEVEVVVSGTQRRTPDQLAPVISTADLLKMITIAGQVHLSPAVLDYIVTITAATRTMTELRLGVSPRGSIALAQAAQALAASEGRSYVTADDVKAMAPAVLAHRMLLRPEAELQGRTPEDLLDGILGSVPVPQQRLRV
jgi:MoxR-like ATPase